ncbi:hypothetical protein BDQ12DRAFT_142422 [Crucibulum laeve]|uniref:Uncharacterized protein n=1 Tax=Crucibulum laeve TaxID=68775 RepID=A0A5C3LGT5_9AGAR|nr:hypothetical protein BDQ12DRAFT_142422 [Crucibulum laeve]
MLLVLQRYLGCIGIQKQYFWRRRDNTRRTGRRTSSASRRKICRRCWRLQSINKQLVNRSAHLKETIQDANNASCEDSRWDAVWAMVPFTGWAPSTRINTGQRTFALAIEIIW